MNDEEENNWFRQAVSKMRDKRIAEHRALYTAGKVTRPLPCVCTCGTTAGRVCEHVWDGPIVEDGFGGQGATCSGCGTSYFGHMFRTAP